MNKRINIIPKNDTFMNKLFNIINDPEEFKAALSKKVALMKNGDTLKVLVGQELKTIKMINDKLEIIHE